MDTFDFVIIGAGPAGEAAAYKARELGASVAVIDRRWFGGSCPHIGCLPSKSLLDGAARHHANPAAYELAGRLRRARLHGQPAAGRRRTRRQRATSTRLTEAGAVVYRGNATITEPRHGRASGTTTPTHDLAGATTSSSRSDPCRRCRRSTGIDEIPYLDQPRGDPRPRAAAQPARPRRRPDRLRAGPGLRPVRRPDDDRPVRTAARADRPPAQLRGAPGGARARRGDRPDRRPGTARRERVPGTTAPTSSTSTMARRRRATPSCSRSGASFPLEDLGLEHYGIDTTGRTPFPRDGRLRIADGLWVIGDPAGPELHTHQAHYQGELAVRMALGEAVEPDYRALPRATYTDPEASSVGVTARGGARGGPRRVRARRRLRDERQGLRGPGQRSAT